MTKKVKEIIEKHQKVIDMIGSILLTIGLNMSISVAENQIRFNGNQIVWFMICIFLYFILKKAKENKEKRLMVCSLILGILLAFFQTIGNLTSGNWISHEVIFSKKIILFMIIKMITYSIIFAKSITILFCFWNYLGEKKGEKRELFKPNLKSFLMITIILLIAWLPYFLNYYPGITSYDTNYQLMQGYKIYEYSNHHPVLHTYIITLLVKIGYGLTRSYNVAIAICSVLQMIASALTFSYVVYYLNKKKMSVTIQILTFLWFAFHPIVPQFSIAIWKDVPFTLCMVWFVIGLIEMVTNEERFLKDKKYNVLYAILITLIMFFRNNGVYIILLTLPFALFFKRVYWKRILLIFILPIIFYYIMTGFVYPKIEIKKSSSREMLSIPMQQMARIVKYKSDELTEQEKQIINQYIPIEEVAEAYRPTISDPIKNVFSEEAYEQDKLTFFKLYVKLALRFPGETLEAFVGNTFGYYYPEVVTFPVATGNYSSPLENEQFINIYSEPIIKIPVLDDIINSLYDKKIPIVSLLANIGFVFWIFLTMLMYSIYQKRYPYLLMYIPIIILYLTCIASPVSGELRYIYSMFTCLPLWIGFTLELGEYNEKN